MPYHVSSPTIALFLNHALVNPPVDRKKPIHEVADVFIHLIKERDDGIIVSGAKMLAIGSAITHATFMAQNNSANLEKGKAEDFALVFIADMDTQGANLICRNSHEDKAMSPFDHWTVLLWTWAAKMSRVLHWRGHSNCVGEIGSIRSPLFGMRDATWYNNLVQYGGIV